MEAKLHPDVRDYLKSLESSEKERCKSSLKLLQEDPYHSRPKCDIKQLKGRKQKMFRLRVGTYRFEYFVEDNTVWITDAFQREKGYR